MLTQDSKVRDRPLTADSQTQPVTRYHQARVVPLLLGPYRANSERWAADDISTSISSRLLTNLVYSPGQLLASTENFGDYRA